MDGSRRTDQTRISVGWGVGQFCLPSSSCLPILVSPQAPFLDPFHIVDRFNTLETPPRPSLQSIGIDGAYRGARPAYSIPFTHSFAALLLPCGMLQVLRVNPTWATRVLERLLTHVLRSFSHISHIYICWIRGSSGFFFPLTAAAEAHAHTHPNFRGGVA